MEDFMAKKQSSSQRKRRSKGISRGKRTARVALVLIEAVMILILSVGCYAVSILGKMEREDIDLSSLYVYTGQNDSLVPQMTDVNGNVPEQTSAEQPETIAEAVQTTAEQRETGAWSVNVKSETTGPEVIVEQSDLMQHVNLVNGYWNILICGVDARANEPLSSGDYRADVIMVCSINATTKEVKLLSVYRDTIMYQPSSKSYVKANDAIFRPFGGGISEIISTINLNMDLNITDAIIVNWAALALVVNCLGGLELEITQEEISKSIITGFLTEVVNETGIGTDSQFSTPGLQLCDGPKVVAYCRNRQTTGSDFGRTNRQREVVEKLLAKAKTADLGTLIQVISVITGNVYTTLSMDEMLSLAQDINNYTIGETSGFPSTSESSQTYLGSWASDFDIKDPLVATDLVNNVKVAHQFLFGDDNYQPSQNVQTISANINSISGF